MTSADTSILLPLTKGEFFADIWETKHCHIKRDAPNYFQPLISTTNISDYISTHAATHPSLQLVHNVENISPSEYTDDQRRINPVVLDEYFANGATLVLSQAHQHFSQLAELCRDVAQQFQMRAQTNVYLSPPGNQGFRSHYDTHDVFILQVSGRKTFRFYPSDVELPFPNDEYDPEQNPHTEVMQEVLLEAGDTLYIPRGLVHDAIAMPDASSLHITLGVYPIIVRDLLQTCIQVAAEQQVSLRKTLMLENTDTKVSNAMTLEAIREQITQCLSEEHIVEAYSRALDDIAIESTVLCQPLFQQPTITAHSIVSINHKAIFGYERLGDTFKLRVHGQVLSFQEPLSSALESLLQTEQMPIEKLPGLDGEQQMALCAHLHNSHVLQVQNT